MEKLITVCVATYNGAQYVRQQLESILTSSRVSEVIVSDDGSTDGTLDIVRSIEDSRIRLLAGPQRGLIKNFENLLMHAKGDYIFLSDQDDVWLKNKIDVMQAALRTADLVVCDCKVVNARLEVIAPSFFAIRKSEKGIWRNLWRNGYLGCCMAFRRGLLTHALPFPAKLPMHDWWLGLLAEVHGEAMFIDQTLMLYRRHGGNASPTSEKSTVSWRLRWQWRMYLAVELWKQKFFRKAKVASTLDSI